MKSSKQINEMISLHIEECQASELDIESLLSCPDSVD